MELYHHGIKGMKWGVRRFQDKNGKLTAAGKKRYSDEQPASGLDRPVISKPGESVELHKNPTSAFANFLGSFIPAVAKNQAAYKDYTIKDKSGNKIGDMSINIDSADSVNLVWVSIGSKNEGHGYGQSAMRTIIDAVRSEGYKNMTLEVPGTSPNARHIYEKYGFKVASEKILGDEDDVWGGLTQMRLDFDSEPELYHHGIKGMKWGRRRFQNADGSLTPAGKRRYGGDDLSKMSDQELRSKVERARLEQQYSTMYSKSKGGRGYNAVRGVLDTAGPALAVGASALDIALATRDDDALSKSKKITNASKNIANNSKNLVDTIHKKQSKPRIDLSNMSDQELRASINRAMLEQQYTSILSSQQESKGYDYVRKTLETAGSVLTIGSSALGIALAVKKLMNK